MCKIMEVKFVTVLKFLLNAYKETKKVSLLCSITSILKIKSHK